MKRILSLILASIMLVGLTACSDGETTKKPASSSEPSTPAETDAKEAEIVPIAAVTLPESIPFDDYDARHERRDEYAVDDSFIDALTAFAAKTAEAALKDEVVCCSPVSLYYALAMAAMGASGETEAELLSLLGASDKDALADSCARLYNLMYRDDGMGVLTVANSMWVDGEFSLKSSYAKELAERFYAECYTCDFSSDATPIAMNAWVRRYTREKLSPEFKKDDEKVMSLMNAIYFMEQWTTPFNEENTEKATFHAPSGDVECDFMNNVSLSSYLSAENYEATEINTANSCSMAFILPKEGVDAHELIAEAVEAARRLRTSDDEGLKYLELTLSLPKFKTGGEAELADAVKTFCPSAFDEEKADFSGISDLQTYVSNITQGTYVAIDENGVEAAAYTELGLCGAGLPAEFATLVFDRPFLYVISDASGAPLFVGIVENPAE